MLNKNIKILKDIWLYSDNCTIKETIDYIKNRGKLRDTQIEAIEIYLFLKIKGQNKPLWELFSDGFFIDNSNFDVVEQILYDKKEIQALALYNFAKI